MNNMSEEVVSKPKSPWGRNKATPPLRYHARQSHPGWDARTFLRGMRVPCPAAHSKYRISPGAPSCFPWIAGEDGYC